MSRSALARYGVAVATVILVSLCKVPIEAWAGSGPPLIFFVPAVTFSAWYGGLWPGLVAAGLSATLCIHLYFPPRGWPLIGNANDAVRLVLFLLEGGLTAVLMEQLHLALRRSEASSREAEEYRDASRRSEERLQAVLDNSTALIYLKDLAGRHILVNHQFKALFQLDGREVIGKTDSEIFPGEFATVLRANDRQVLEAGRAQEYEEVLPLEDGPHTYVSLKFPLFDPGGVPYALGSVSTDITPLKDAQRRALQSERLAAIGQMVAGLAHESRNALQRGQACLEMLALRLKDQIEALDLVAGAQEAQDDLHRIYEEVRHYAAPIRLDRRACALREVLHAAWSRLGPIRQSRDVRVREPEGPSPTCEVDHYRLVQVLCNILENALAAAVDPVEIDIEWGESELGGQPAVSLVVRDNGPGLSVEQRKNLFEPFFTTKTQGTGLGMAIARRIVEAHGGWIAVGPDDGRGASILITLPRGKV